MRKLQISFLRPALCGLVVLSAFAALALSAHLQALAAKAPATTTQANWLQLQYNADRTNANLKESILSPSTVSQLTLAWTFGPSARLISSPIIVNGIVYLVRDNFLYGRDAVTGAPKFAKNVGYSTQNYPSLAFSDGLLYSTPTLGGVIAINAATTRTVWQFTNATSKRVSFGFVVSGGVVYFIGGQGRQPAVYALNAASGAIQWQYIIHSSESEAPPTVANGTVYVPVGNMLYALDDTTGALKWIYTAAVKREITGTPAVVSGTVYLPSSNGLMALDAATGAIKWSTTIPGTTYIFSPLAIANGVIYLASGGSGSVYAVYAGDGKIKWSVPVSTTESIGSLTLANGVIYVGSYDSTLYALDAASGTTLWHYTTGGPISNLNLPVVVNGMVYVTANDRKLYAFHLPG